MTGWTLVTQPYPDGHAEQLFERAKPGHPDTVQRIDAETFRERTRAQQPPLASSSVDATGSAGLIRKVVVTAWASRCLREQRFDSIFEVGGGLFGYVDAARGELVIDDVTGRLADATERSGRLDAAYIDHISERHAETTGLRLCGNWHTHPYVDGSEPSRTDRACWTSWYRHGGEQPFIGLLVSKSASQMDDQTWAHPVIAAHAVSRGRDGEATIRAVPVEVEPEPVPSWRQ
jgi:hypothetical protein